MTVTDTCACITWTRTATIRSCGKCLRNEARAAVRRDGGEIQGHLLDIFNVSRAVQCMGKAWSAADRRGQRPPCLWFVRQVKESKGGIMMNQVTLSRTAGHGHTRMCVRVEVHPSYGSSRL